MGRHEAVSAEAHLTVRPADDGKKWGGGIEEKIEGERGQGAAGGGRRAAARSERRKGEVTKNGRGEASGLPWTHVGLTPKSTSWAIKGGEGEARPREKSCTRHKADLLVFCCVCVS